MIAVGAQRGRTLVNGILVPQTSDTAFEVVAISEQAVALTVGNVSGMVRPSPAMAAMRASVAFGK
jgi:hypothetical protein